MKKSLLIMFAVALSMASITANAQWAKPEGLVLLASGNIADAYIGAADSSHSLTSIKPIEFGFSVYDSVTFYFVFEDSAKVWFTGQRVHSSNVIDTASIQIIQVGKGVVVIPYSQLVKTFGGGLGFWPYFAVRRLLFNPAGTCMASAGKKWAIYYEIHKSKP